jgi:hypothetical protein
MQHRCRIPHKTADQAAQRTSAIFDQDMKSIVDTFDEVVPLSRLQFTVRQSSVVTGTALQTY